LAQILIHCLLQKENSQEILVMHNDKGFSLMELMTVIATLSILAAIAIPGFIGWRNNAQLGRAARDVYSSFQKAKAESVRRNGNCGIEFRANDYVIYMDSDLSFDFNASNDQVIQTVNWSQYPGVRLDLSQGGGDGLSFSNPDTGIVFAPDGLPRNNVGSLGSGTVFITFQNSSRQNTVTISTVGNIQIN
jgi:type IV fimbrial biogenesis protein FimT